MELSAGLIFSGILLGAVGMWLLIRGKRDAEPSSLFAGIALSGLPILVHGLLPLWLTAAGVMGAWAWIQRQG